MGRNRQPPVRQPWAGRYPVSRRSSSPGSGCGPSAWDDTAEPLPDWDLFGQPQPNLEYDQRIAWSPSPLAGEGAVFLVSRLSAAPQNLV